MATTMQINTLVQHGWSEARAKNLTKEAARDIIRELIKPQADKTATNPESNDGDGDEGEDDRDYGDEEEEQSSPQSGRPLQSAVDKALSRSLLGGDPAKVKATDPTIQAAVDAALANSSRLQQAVDEYLDKHGKDLLQSAGIADAMRAIANAQADAVEDALDESESSLEKWKNDAEQKMLRKVEFVIPEMPTVELDEQHPMFEQLVRNALLRLPTLLVGPSGSGKSRATMELAKVLGLEYSYVAMGPTQTESKFSGFPNVEGVLVPTEYFLAYKYGRLLTIDEIDAAEPSVLLWINNSISNKIATFPRGFMSKLEADGYAEDAKELQETGGIVPMHENCVIVATANTLGKGGDMRYPGRNPLDSSTLKRFVVLLWDYDEAMERKLAGNDLWVDAIQLVRSIVLELDMEHVVSPVDSFNGAKLIAAGTSPRLAMHMTALGSMNADEKRRVQDHKNWRVVKHRLDKLSEEAALPNSEDDDEEDIIEERVVNDAR